MRLRFVPDPFRALYVQGSFPVIVDNGITVVAFGTVRQVLADQFPNVAEWWGPNPLQ